MWMSGDVFIRLFNTLQIPQTPVPQTFRIFPHNPQALKTTPTSKKYDILLSFMSEIFSFLYF